MVCLCLVVGGAVARPMRPANETFREKLSVFWIRGILLSDSGKLIYERLFPEETKYYKDWIKKGAPITLDPKGSDFLNPVNNYTPKRRLRFFTKDQNRWGWRTNWYVSMDMGMDENASKRKAGQQALEVLKENWTDCLVDASSDMVSTLSRPLRTLGIVIKRSKSISGIFQHGCATIDKIYFFFQNIYGLLLCNIAVITGLIANVFIYRKPGFTLAVLLLSGSLGINVVLGGAFPRYAESFIPFSGFGLYGVWLVCRNIREKLRGIA